MTEAILQKVFLEKYFTIKGFGCVVGEWEIFSEKNFYQRQDNNISKLNGVLMKLMSIKNR